MQTASRPTTANHCSGNASWASEKCKLHDTSLHSFSRKQPAAQQQQTTVVEMQVKQVKNASSASETMQAKQYLPCGDDTCVHAAE